LDGPGAVWILKVLVGGNGEWRWLIGVKEGVVWTHDWLVADSEGERARRGLKLALVIVINIVARAFATSYAGGGTGEVVERGRRRVLGDELLGRKGLLLEGRG